MARFMNLFPAVSSWIARQGFPGSIGGGSLRSLAGPSRVRELERGSHRYSGSQSFLVSVLYGAVMSGCMADDRGGSLFDVNGLGCWVPNQVLFGGEEWDSGGYLAMAKFITEGDHVVFCSGGDLSYRECLIGVRRMGVYWQWRASGEDFVGRADARCVVYFAEPLAVAGVRVPVFRVRPMFTAVGLRCFYEDIFEAKFYEAIEDELIKPREHAVDVSEYLKRIKSASPEGK